MPDDWTTDFERFEMGVGEIAETRGRVVPEVVQRGTGKISGVEVEGRFWLLCTVEDGKLCRLDSFASREQAVEAARRALSR